MARLLALLLQIAAAHSTAQQVSVAVEAAPDGTRTLVHEVVVPAPPATVWTALATEAGWVEWAVPLARKVPGSEDRFETSYNPAAAPGAADTIEQQWITRTAPTTVSFRTTRTPQGFPHGDAYRKITSTFTLTREGTGTHVRLTTTGYGTDEAGDALLAFFREGNRMTLEQLRNRFVSGPIDWAAKLAR